jgi:hypothetical protein
VEHSALGEALDYLVAYKAAHRHADKAEMSRAYEAAFTPRRARSVFVGAGYALRFTQANQENFSNTVLSLSALRLHDHQPLVVVIVRPSEVSFLLANSSVLARISHSSSELRPDHIRGSFNGWDIMRSFAGLENRRENFSSIFELHQASVWDETVERLAEVSAMVKARRPKFVPSATQRAAILDAPRRAAEALDTPHYLAISVELASRVQGAQRAILDAARNENGNLRGQEVERLITGGENGHRLDDLGVALADGQLSIDVKSKRLNRSSAPKAYNVDKMLDFLAQPGSVAAILAIGIDTDRERVVSSLVPVLDRELLRVTGVQHHWAGRGSRGVTQFSADWGVVFDGSHRASIDVAAARTFLQHLIEL